MTGRYRIGYHRPGGSGHIELIGSEEYNPCCGSKGWDVYLDAEPGDEGLPAGEWVTAPAPSWAELMRTIAEHYPPDVFAGSGGDPGPQIVALAREVDRLRRMRTYLAEQLGHAAGAVPPDEELLLRVAFWIASGMRSVREREGVQGTPLSREELEAEFIERGQRAAGESS